MEKASSKIYTIRPEMSVEQNIDNSQIIIRYDNLANKLPETNISKTPNKPFHCTYKLAGIFSSKISNQRNSDLLEGQESKATRETLKEVSTKSTTHDTATVQEEPK